MLSLIFIVTFVCCFGIALIAVLIGHQLISTYNAAFHRNYFYYLIAFFTFAIYGIWGQLAIRAFIQSIEKGNETYEVVINLIPVLSIPFLIISWIMLVKIAYTLVGATPNKKALLIHLIILLLTAIGISFLFIEKPLFLDKYFLMALPALISVIELAHVLVFTVIVLGQLKKVQATKRRKITLFTILIITGFVLRSVLLIFHLVGPWLLTPLILIYFISNLLPLWFIKIHSDHLFPPIFATRPNNNKKAFLYQKYQITQREQEIIEQVCSGKTNQQIADTLFISLQTVKDHTHRIYGKVGINSRMKLVQLVNN